MTHRIVKKFLSGVSAGVVIRELELEIERLQKRVNELEAAQQSVQRTADGVCENCGNNCWKLVCETCGAE